MTPSLEEKPIDTAPAPKARGSVLAPVAAAFQFLTVAPPLVRRPFTPEELGRSVGWFPLVGLLLGGLLAGLNWSLGFLFPPGVTAALLLAAWVICTGALHLDGFLDSCDGVFGGHTPEVRLRIMRDERAGAFAVIGGILLLLVKYAALTANPERLPALLVAPVIGRWGMALALVAFPYARPEGLGRAMKDHAGAAQLVVASAVAGAAAAALAGLVPGGWRAALALPLGGVIVGAGGAFVLRRLPGLTGDVYGALCTLAEAAVLLLFVAGGNHA
ncbi:MAG TPA: adenosylcobinamide-GDP ribazoletransferase, partial [Gemmataceae bacterium]|nr:adenosylcobinamide-GDP ribazoletransferase [Gemmataceae bacterium]